MVQGDVHRQFDNQAGEGGSRGSGGLQEEFCILSENKRLKEPERIKSCKLEPELNL